MAAEPAGVPAAASAEITADNHPAVPPMTLGAADSVEPRSAEHGAGASTPLVDDVGEASGPTVADDPTAAADEQGRLDAPDHDVGSAASTLDSQLVVLPGVSVPDGAGDEEVRRLRNVLCTFSLHL